MNETVTAFRLLEINAILIPLVLILAQLALRRVDVKEKKELLADLLNLIWLFLIMLMLSAISASMVIFNQYAASKLSVQDGTLLLISISLLMFSFSILPIVFTELTARITGIGSIKHTLKELYNKLTNRLEILLITLGILGGWVLLWLV